MEKLMEISLLIFCLQLGWVSCLQKVEQSPQFLRVQEGESITINCNFTENPQGLQWFRQDAGKGPISLFYLASGMKEEGRFKCMINLKERHSSLLITASQPGDSATYHCAVRARLQLGGIRPLVFGKGTRLEVVPELQEPSMPSVFVMKNGTNVACLVKDFYPKTVDIHLDPDDNTKEGMVTIANGKFSAIKLGQYKNDLEQINCTVRHNNKTMVASYKRPFEKSSDLKKDSDQELSSPKCHKPTVQIEKLNLLSITLLGLRVLLAKSIAVNLFLTIKCFLLSGSSTPKESKISRTH